MTEWVVSKCVMTEWVVSKCVCRSLSRCPRHRQALCETGFAKMREDPDQETTAAASATVRVV